MSGSSDFHILQTAHQSSGTDRHAQTVLAPTPFVKHIRQVSATHSWAFPSIRSGLRDSKRPVNTACTPRLVGSCPSNVALTLLGKVVASAPKPLASSGLLERPALILALRKTPRSLRITELRGLHQAYNPARRILRPESAKAVPYPSVKYQSTKQPFDSRPS